MDLNLAKQTFREESRELLDQIEQNLLELEEDPKNKDALGSLFRAIHTLKGSAGMFQYENIVHFTHVAENILDQAREGSLAMSPELVTILLASHDHMGTLVQLAVDSDNQTLDGETRDQGELLLSQLSAFQGEPEPGSSQHSMSQVSHEKALPMEKAMSVEEEEQAFAELPVEAGNWHISLRFGREVFKQGLDPISFIRYLKKIGDIINLVTVPDAIPEAEHMDPESCYLGFEIDVRSDVDKVTIEKVFEFVEEDCKINILPPYSKISQYRQLIRDLPETPMRVGEILHFCGALTKKELDQALDEQFFSEGQHGADAELKSPLGEILVNQKAIHPEVLNAALEKQLKNESSITPARDQRDIGPGEKRFIRVDAGKLDQLINLIGELVIASASVNDQVERIKDSGLLESVSMMGRLVSDIRDTTLNVRMVQIGETFNRYRRIVRDLSLEMHKNVELVISGGDTELDKTIIEKITDPLTHLIRNAMDHGIDLAEERKAKNKPEKGEIRLNAYHETGTIVIEVIDDGNGLNKEAILEKAIATGIVQPNQVLNEQEIFKLIFHAGFSTARKVTDVSGRGVGMDVVRRNIESLRGLVDIESKEGEGTRVRIRLPLTLAIIDGFMVGVGKSKWVVPLDMVVECVDFSGANQDSIEIDQHEDFVNLRGEVLPFLRLKSLFGGIQEIGKQQNIVVVQYAGQKAGLLVDELMGEFQTVIKSLGPVFQNLRGISGATILGNGEVALIIDVPRLVQQAKEMEEKARSRKNI
jgi:two-component system chemotaxis sensor kinase CheA